MAKKLTKQEARFIALDYFISFALEMGNTDSDFYEGIRDQAVLDKTKLEKGNWDVIEYYPKEEDRKVIAKEMDRLFWYFNNEMKKAREKYLKNCSSHKPVQRRTKQAN
jgi:hypothetical protein